MPKGQHDSRETKEFMFNVIKFFEEEKDRAPIPLFNVNDRIMAALQIPHDALLLEQQQQQRPYVLAQKYKNECFRRRSSSPYTRPINDQSRNSDIPRPAANPPAKRDGPGCLKISLTEYEKDLWRRNEPFWVDNQGQGRIRTNQGTGPRVAISALINENDFHHPSADMFKCNQEHSMDSMHFIRWIGETCSKLRKELCKSLDYLIVHDAFYKGNAHSITIIIDNASWHRELTNNAKSPQRS
ncbi:unnamed protein product [Rotaria sp. Silwood1]|nr:unnamed protein product [Rotaria sp. Silwood1]CAF3628871.1 unnamed protein product [Rotaria sp. Silwood1]CAF4801926.1 unnamed protein product [Rotaria sp. Silwood1]